MANQFVYCGGRAVELRQQHWIARLIVEKLFRACPPDSIDFALDPLNRCRRIAALALCTQLRQRLKRMFSRAEPREQLAIGYRPDVL